MKAGFRRQKIKFRVGILLFFFAASCILYPASCFAFSIDDEITKIQKFYENTKDIRGSFIQKSYIKDLKRTDTYKGQFFIKSAKMKLEYKGEKPQFVYINGDAIIIHQKNEQQVFKGRFDRATYGQTPIALLNGFADIKNDFDVATKNNKLLLKPKKTMGNISTIEISTSDSEFPIESMTITDRLSNRIDIHLKDVKVNTGFKDSVFEFKPPEGVTVLQQ